MGANPTRQPLQPEATGAAMEVKKWLKPSDSVSRKTVTEKDNAQADLTAISGKADTAG